MQKFKPKKVETYKLSEWQGAFATLPQGLLKRMLSPRQYNKYKKFSGIIVFDKKYAFLVQPFIEAVASQKWVDEVGGEKIDTDTKLV